ncbi:MAG TPA: outer membrane beta-barrel protein [Thermoanaerobaculia bacterium]|nr:outer membrane beta-barrel protein [Thermoanaerobaculia bacterium]
MKRVLAVLMLAMPAAAAEIEAGATHVIMMAGDSDDLTIDTSRGFGAHAEVFWSDALSTRAAATFVNPAVYTPSTDLGTLGLDILSATARWHIAPRSRLSAYAGAGGALVVFGNLEDQAGGGIESEFDSKLAPVVEGGLRYRIHPRIALEAGAAYVPLEAEGDEITVAVDPLIVSVGASWRF